MTQATEDLQLAPGARLELWAGGAPGTLRIRVGQRVVWQVPSFPEQPGFFSYRHMSTDRATIEWSGAGAISWAYSWHPDDVAHTGITAWDFGPDGITRRTGQEITEWMCADPDRPRIHFSPVRQWMNDPNGFCRIGDTWHLFYQFHPASRDWGPMHWGHATSKDLVHWTHLPVFLHPEQPLWPLGATGGAFSGSTFLDREGAPVIFYTERLPAYDLVEGYTEIQKRAEPGPGLLGVERTTVVLEDRPDGVVHDFRDPKVWWDQAARAYRMVLGGAIDGDPAVLLYGSDDQVSWSYLGPLYRAPAKFKAEGARAVECPDFFPLDGRWVLVMGFVGHTDPGSGRHNLLFALVGDFENDRFETDGVLQLLDFGTDFYAMQSCRAGDRQVAIAWLFNWENRKPPGSPYSGEMSLPRELSVDARGRLCMSLVDEIAEACPAQTIPGEPGGGFHLPDAPIDLSLTGSLDGTRIVATQDGDDSFVISVENGVLSVRVPCDDGEITYSAEIPGARDLRVLHDRGILEIFADNGSVCGTRRSYDNVSPDRLQVETSANLRLDAWTTGS
ncbi:GH32 C-terminal domain-containing protein [Histidinibacterium aquaticum]|uniref:beta-fructofuranosidase n=1 Tax=Histidinibacterium aquaticum TaxID=2613962 RepID=A0A5J5GNW9_9RHOB|nr:GH32 C-terminal domain-containing protein [Histidinibacterium aquaticum]KAA9010009.1 glycoside hydrolase family 32 protein [Histidinibacterium aquaticum]